MCEDVLAALSTQYGAEVEHWYAEQGCDFCGYGRYSNGEITGQLSDSLEWGDPDPEDEDGCPDVTGPAWIIDYIAHLAQYPEDALCCGTFWQADDFLSLDATLTEDDIDAAMELAQDSHDAGHGFNWSHLQAAVDEVTRV